MQQLEQHGPRWQDTAATDAPPDSALDAGSSDSSSDAADSSAPLDASQDSGLCGPISNTATTISATSTDASAPAPSSFTGGTIESGTYWATSYVYYGGPLAVTMKQTWLIDAVAHTLHQAESDNGGATTQSTADYATSSHTMTLTPACSDAGTSQVYYTVTGTGTGATVTIEPVGQPVTLVFTKQ